MLVAEQTVPVEAFFYSYKRVQTSFPGAGIGIGAGVFYFPRFPATFWPPELPIFRVFGHTERMYEIRTPSPMHFVSS